MATSSFDKDFTFETQSEVDALFDAIERSAKARGIDLDGDAKKVAEIIERFGTHEKLYKQKVVTY